MSHHRLTSLLLLSASIAALADPAPLGAAVLDDALVGGCGAVHLMQSSLRIGRASSAGNLKHETLLGIGQDPYPTFSFTTPPPTGVTMNAAGDLSAFMSAVWLNAGVVLFCVGAFCFLRVRYPSMYSNNVLIGEAPSTPVDSYFSWVRASLNTTIDQATESIGLDNAMMLEFTHLGMRILAIIGVPMLCVLSPMNYFLGGGAAGEDHMSYLSIGNVEDGSWLYWVYAAVVWAVVITVQLSVYKAQRAFMPRRMRWLRGMAVERANTVLVERIPAPQQSDEALKAKFGTLFPGGKVKSAYVVKYIVKLERLVRELSAAERSLHEAEFILAQKPGMIPMAREFLMGSKVEAVPMYTEKVKRLMAEIDQEKERALAISSTPGVAGGNCCNGFVTFNERSDAEHALRMDVISPDYDEWVISTPPEPSDIQWRDLTQDPTAQTGRTLAGYGLVAALYILYLPCVIGITNIANLVNMGPLQPLWQGIAPTLGLQFMVCFLPTFLIIIFQVFFTLRAAAWAQHQLQVWYFWFQVVFVVLAAAVGQNAVGFTRALLTAPFSVFGVLADTMPFATHFFMNYMLIQMASHSMNIMRYVPLTKFKVFSLMYEAEQARQMAEPEDQDFYGLGSRSARWTIMMTIALVFGTLCPPIYVLCFLNFALCRLIYGYLLPFAETRKPDLGGVFWVTMLEHLFVSLTVYCILMTGILYRRAATAGPMLVAAPSVFYVFWSLHRFTTEFAWEKLPFEEVMKECPKTIDVERRTLSGEYKQPELMD